MPRFAMRCFAFEGLGEAGKGSWEGWEGVGRALGTILEGLGPLLGGPRALLASLGSSWERP